jgi:phosphoribosylglycinamide formyltransferase-1
VSGGGTNLQAILDRIDAGGIPQARVAVVVASKPDAFALERARRHGVPAEVVDRKACATMEEFERALIDKLKAHGVGLVVMGGFNHILGPGFIESFGGQIINVHPALIPSFAGKGFYGLVPHRKALEYGVKVTGATVHFVEAECDAGPILLQKAIPVREDDTPESLQKRVMEECEWTLLPEAVRLISEGRVARDGRKVTIREGR